MTNTPAPAPPATPDDDPRRWKEETIRLNGGARMIEVTPQGCEELSPQIVDERLLAAAGSEVGATWRINFVLGFRTDQVAVPRKYGFPLEFVRDGIERFAGRGGALTWAAEFRSPSDARRPSGADYSAVTSLLIRVYEQPAGPTRA